MLSASLDDDNDDDEYIVPTLHLGKSFALKKLPFQNTLLAHHVYFTKNNRPLGARGRALGELWASSFLPKQEHNHQNGEFRQIKY